MDKGQWPKLNYVSCDDYQEDQPITRKGVDLRKALREVTEPPSYAPMMLEELNGHSYMEVR